MTAPRPETESADLAADRALAADLEAWFLASKRPFPWRPADPAAPRDPWLALVSEIMLQQTQAARVAERFPVIVDRFPTPRALADAPVDELLALWSGLGYYRRARLLHACAQAIVERHSGTIPTDAHELRALPGVGRYTAGAVASIALGQREPLVDGNVARVLQRLHARAGGVRERDNEKWAWARAGELVEAAGEPGVFNEALMELGATVCTPRSPRCEGCPVRSCCTAFATGQQEDIPSPSPRAKRSVVHCVSLIVTDAPGRFLLEQRGESTGLWAGMWQVPTHESQDAPPDADEVARSLGVRLGDNAGELVHLTTHREVRFAVHLAVGAPARLPEGARWVAPEALGTLAISSAQRRVLALAPTYPRP